MSDVGSKRAERCVTHHACDCQAYDLAQSKVALSCISGTLMDAGDIPVDPLPEGVAALLADRNRLRVALNQALTALGQWDTQRKEPAPASVVEMRRDAIALGWEVLR